MLTQSATSRALASRMAIATCCFPLYDDQFTIGNGTSHTAFSDDAQSSSGDMFMFSFLRFPTSALAVDDLHPRVVPDLMLAVEGARSSSAALLTKFVETSLLCEQVGYVLLGFLCCVLLAKGVPMYIKFSGAGTMNYPSVDSSDVDTSSKSIWEQFEGFSDHLHACGSICKSLGSFGSIWKHFVAFGCI